MNKLAKNIHNLIAKCEEEKIYFDICPLITSYRWSLNGIKGAIKN